MTTMTMGQSKITGAHPNRLAVIYIRQSTLAQVRDHGESTLRRYALPEDAERLGWPTERRDRCRPGLSGRGGSPRNGFKDLVGCVCCGEVGAVFGLQVSRLARSSADLQRLLELCSLTDTLIVDGDGIYDLGQFNDRLLLGRRARRARPSGMYSPAACSAPGGRRRPRRAALHAPGRLRLRRPRQQRHRPRRRGPRRRPCCVRRI